MSGLAGARCSLVIYAGKARLSYFNLRRSSKADSRERAGANPLGPSAALSGLITYRLFDINTVQLLVQRGSSGSG